MNKTYRTIFNAATGKLAVASELAKGSSKSSKRATVLTAVSAAVVVLAAPSANAANYNAGDNSSAGNAAFGCAIAAAPLLPTGCSPSNNFNLTQYGDRRRRKLERNRRRGIR